MNYTIIPDSKLNMETLLELNTLVFTESEVKSFQNTLWTWSNITNLPLEKILKDKGKEMHDLEKEKPLEKDIKDKNIKDMMINLLIDIGYIAFSEVMTMDNTIKKAVELQSIDPNYKITLSGLSMTNKIEQLDKLSKIMDIKSIEPLNQRYLSPKKRDIYDRLFEYKMRGWEIASMCFDYIKELDSNEIKSINIISSKDSEIKFSEIISYAKKMNATKAFLKGSYINYVESQYTSNLPSDIDVVILIKDLDKSRYFNILEEKSFIRDIDIIPLIIPDLYKNAHTFFDLDMSKGGKLIYLNPEYSSDSGSNSMIMHPEKIIRVMGNNRLSKIRSLAVNRNMINKLCSSETAHRKIYSLIRTPEIYYRILKENNIDHLVTKPVVLSSKFDKNMPTVEIQKLLFESSINLSYMNSMLEQYISNKN
ncbi:MAG: hypothetical protein ACP5N1_05795 [Candidatus Woesearchaeota archaeon]